MDIRPIEKVAEKFRTIAGKREAGGHGYGDHNSDWKATPEALRKAVDAYNGANQHTKDLYIQGAIRGTVRQAQSATRHYLIFVQKHGLS